MQNEKGDSNNAQKVPNSVNKRNIVLDGMIRKHSPWTNNNSLQRIVEAENHS